MKRLSKFEQVQTQLALANSPEAKKRDEELRFSIASGEMERRRVDAALLDLIATRLEKLESLSRTLAERGITITRYPDHEFLKVEKTERRS